MRRLLAATVVLAAVAGSAWGAYQLWPRDLTLSPPAPSTPLVNFTNKQTTVTNPGRILVADAARFEDEFFAYLMFDYLRGLVTRDGGSVWLTYEREGKSLSYMVRVQPPGDFLRGLPYLYSLANSGLISETDSRWVLPSVADRYEFQSRIFDKAYNLPTHHKLEAMPRTQLAAYVRRFIRFKATIDGRVRRGGEAAPKPPSRPEAHDLAEDIVAITDFFSLPIDFFLGIGAMENNYMNVRGDLGNAVWKRRPQRGDVVLKRGKRGVLVLNESSGIWQITQETLRYAHKLYLKDTRDYTQLPEHLRPPQELDVTDIPPEVLTTYAGLFFRDLLDRFVGDVATAVGAYNGGPGNPNPRYEEGVRVVAQHARRVLEHAAALQGRPAAGMHFLGPAAR